MTVEAIDTRTARAWLDGHVINVVVHPGAQVTLADAQEHMRVGRELAVGLDYTLLLIDMGALRSIDREARIHYRSGSSQGAVENRAVAIVVESPLARSIANFFIGLNRPATPVKLFTDAQQARAWLHSFEG